MGKRKGPNPRLAKNEKFLFVVFAAWGLLLVLYGVAR